MHGGHFYGGHIAMAMDSMKTAIANLADLLSNAMNTRRVAMANNGGNDQDDDSDGDWDDD